MKNGNDKIQKAKKLKYSIKDYQNDKEVFDKETQERIDTTIVVLKAIDRQQKLLKNGKNKISSF